MEAKGLRRSTITNVLGLFRQLIEFAGVKECYGRDDVDEFLASKTRSGCSGTTVHNYYRFLKIVFDRMGWPWELTTKDLPKKNRPYRPYYDEEDALRLAEAAAKAVTVGGRYGKMLKLRNTALIRLDSVTMLRIGEVRMLDVDDYRRPILRIRNPEKNSEYTERILDSETCDVLDAYLEARKRARHPALFIAGRGRSARRLSLRGLSDILLRIRRAAGVDRPRGGWHAFRRGGLTEAHKGGTSEKALSEYTGITPKIVQGYIQLDTSAAKEQFVKGHPRFKKELDRIRERLVEQLKSGEEIDKQSLLKLLEGKT